MNLSFLKHPAVQIVEAVARGPRETQASPRRRNHPKTKRINWNDGADALVEITGIGFFDRPRGQIGRAPNNFEIHPILAIRFLDQPTPSTNPTAGAKLQTDRDKLVSDLLHCFTRFRCLTFRRKTALS
jgi:hypothetical protein